MLQEEEQTLALADIEIRKERLNICHSCEFIKKPICGKCKCLLRLKTLFTGQQCPIGKWGIHA